ncbi:MAG: transcriptional regulator [Cellvibrio sp. 79]|nr:MAG: transcriptional regulator [Cellvibrio sp. 79]
MNNLQPLSLGDALFSKTQQKVLGLLFTNPDQSFFANEIVRWAGLGKGTVMRELEKLHVAGLISRVQIGNQSHYQANPGCPIYADIAAIVRKTFGIGDTLKVALAPLATQITQAFIYGSIAKGEATANSDIDLMLVGDDLSYTRVMELLAPAEEILGRTINPTLYNAQDFAAKLNAGNHFLQRVMEQARIPLWDESLV